MRLYLFIFYLVFLNFFSNTAGIKYDPSEIHGYHFHTYFFQNNEENTKEALNFREAIQQQISSGKLSNCRLNHVNSGPRGPHPVGSYETCCNKTSISPALSFFMLNHGNLSILLHPLTRFEMLDHTDRSMFLGPRFPVDVSVLSKDLENNLDLCLPLQNPDGLFNFLDLPWQEESFYEEGVEPTYTEVVQDGFVQNNSQRKSSFGERL